MSPSALIVVGVLTPLSGIVGSLLWPIIQRKCQWSSLKVLVTLVIMASLLPAYGCLGFIIPSRVGFGGLTTQGEMFALAIYFGEWNVTHRSFGWPKLARYMKGRSMVHSKVMQELSTPNYFLLAKKRVGMDSIQSQTRQVFLHVANDRTPLMLGSVKFFHWASCCRFDFGLDRQHSVCIFLPRYYDLGCSTIINGHRH